MSFNSNSGPFQVIYGYSTFDDYILYNQKSTGDKMIRELEVTKKANPIIRPIYHDITIRKEYEESPSLWQRLVYKSKDKSTIVLKINKNIEADLFQQVLRCVQKSSNFSEGKICESLLQDNKRGFYRYFK